MNSNETIDNGASEQAQPRPLLGQILIYVGLCLTLGCSAVAIGNTLAEGVEAIPLLLMAAITLSGIAMLVIGVRIGNFDAPSFGSKTGRAQLILVASAGFGGVLGFYIIFTGMMDRFIEGDFTISRIEAIVALLILFLVMLPMAVIREKNADDYEKAAAKEASYWSFSVYLYGYMAWSIAAEGGLVPAVNSVILFFFLVFLFLGIWAFKRSG